MTSPLRESRINAAFVSVADTLTKDYDEVEFLESLVADCADLLGMAGGGLMLADAAGELHLVTATSAGAQFVEIMALNAADGPCIDSFRSGQPVSVGDIATCAETWPAFVQAALAQGFRSVLAIPMKLRGNVIGTMNLFGATVGEVSARDASLAQALADVATIGILQERLLTEKQELEAHLQRALASRVVIEQAKGFLASSLGTTVDESFELLRRYARDRNLTIRSVSEQVASGTLAADDVAAAELKRAVS